MEIYIINYKEGMQTRLLPTIRKLNESDDISMLVHLPNQIETSRVNGERRKSTLGYVSRLRDNGGFIGGTCDDLERLAEIYIGMEKPNIFVITEERQMRRVEKVFSDLGKKYKIINFY